MTDEKTDDMTDSKTPKIRLVVDNTQGWENKPCEEWTVEEQEQWAAYVSQAWQEDITARFNSLSAEDALDEFRRRSSAYGLEDNWRKWADTKWARQGRVILR